MKNFFKYYLNNFLDIVSPKWVLCVNLFDGTKLVCHAEQVVSKNINYKIFDDVFEAYRHNNVRFFVNSIKRNDLITKDEEVVKEILE